MMQTVSKWKVTYTFPDGLPSISLYLYDDHMSNVLRQAAGIGFDVDPTAIGLENLQPKPTYPIRPRTAG